VDEEDLEEVEFEHVETLSIATHRSKRAHELNTRYLKNMGSSFQTASK
jgi:hypothetical protein